MKCYYFLNWQPTCDNRNSPLSTLSLLIVWLFSSIWYFSTLSTWYWKHISFILLCRWYNWFKYMIHLSFIVYNMLLVIFNVPGMIERCEYCVWCLMVLSVYLLIVLSSLVSIIFSLLYFPLCLYLRIVSKLRTWNFTWSPWTLKKLQKKFIKGQQLLIAK